MRVFPVRRKSQPIDLMRVFPVRRKSQIAVDQGRTQVTVIANTIPLNLPVKERERQHEQNNQSLPVPGDSYQSPPFEVAVIDVCCGTNLLCIITG